MQLLQWGGLVRTTKSRAEIEDATRMAFERKREGYSPEALAMALNEVLDDEALSRAIVLFVQSDTEQKGKNIERPSTSWPIICSSVQAGSRRSLSNASRSAGKTVGFPSGK